MLKILSGLIIAYLLGSIPTAYLLAKGLKGIDLCDHGSGNLGATNAFRVLGKAAGTTVLIIDILKGLLAILSARSLFFSPGRPLSQDLYLCLAALAVVCGHNWSLWLGFKGGKGIATSLGALIALSSVIPGLRLVIFSSLILWILVFLISGFVSLASIMTAFFLPVFSFFFRLQGELIFFFFVLAILALYRHKANIQRLLQKKESRFNPLERLRKTLRKKTLS